MVIYLNRYRESDKTMIQKLAYYGIFLKKEMIPKALEAIFIEFNDEYALFNQKKEDSKIIRLKKITEPFSKNEIDKSDYSRLKRGFYSNVIHNLYETNLIGYLDVKDILKNLPNGYRNFISNNDFGTSLSLTANNYEAIGYSKFIKKELSDLEKYELFNDFDNLILNLSENSNTILESYSKFKEYILSGNQKFFHQ